ARAARRADGLRGRGRPRRGRARRRGAATSPRGRGEGRLTMLPLSYALRNLSRRAVRTTLTLLGVGLVAFLVILMTGFATGLDSAVSSSARGDVAYVVGSAGETDLVRSFVSMGSAQEAAQSAPGVLEVDGRRAAGPELHSESRMGNQIVLVRGVTDA